MKYFATVFFSLFLSCFLLADIINIPGDHPNIQAGINAASNGDTVLVANGLYFDNINFEGKAITVASHFIIDGDSSHISATIIDGSLPSDPDSGSVVTFNSGEDTTSVLAGFTITGGTGTIGEYTWQGETFTSRNGGGVLTYNAGATIRHNVITNNNIPSYESSYGGGISVYAGDGSTHARISDNTISANTIIGMFQAAGSAIYFLGKGSIENNTIHANTSNADNEAFGAILCWGDTILTRTVIKNNRITENITTGELTVAGGIQIEVGTQTKIIGNTISGNILNGTTFSQGGGIRVLWTTEADTISGNYIAGNKVYGSQSSGGGIIVRSTENTSTTVITNNIIARNYAGNGGGIYCHDSFVRISNNTIVSNWADNDGGGIRVSGSPTIVSIINNILWHNTAFSDAQASTTANVFYSNVQGGFSGIGNISDDPLFADTTAYYLSENSPCIDAGHPDPLYNDPEDPANPGFALWPAMGTLRNDMGAYGGPGSDTIMVYLGVDGIEELPISSGNLPAGFQLFQNYPNPFNPSTTIEFTIAKGGWVTLEVYNVLGEVVAELAAEELSAGSYKYNWHADGLPSGVYFYRLDTKGFNQTKKLLLLK